RRVYRKALVEHDGCRFRCRCPGAGDHTQRRAAADPTRAAGPRADHMTPARACRALAIAVALPPLSATISALASLLPTPLMLSAGLRSRSVGLALSRGSGISMLVSIWSIAWLPVLRPMLPCAGLFPASGS